MTPIVTGLILLVFVLMLSMMIGSTNEGFQGYSVVYGPRGPWRRWRNPWRNPWGPRRWGAVPWWVE